MDTGFLAWTECSASLWASHFDASEFPIETRGAISSCSVAAVEWMRVALPVFSYKSQFTHLSNAITLSEPLVYHIYDYYVQSKVHFCFSIMTIKWRYYKQQIISL